IERLFARLRMRAHQRVEGAAHTLLELFLVGERDGLAEQLFLRAIVVRSAHPYAQWAQHVLVGLAEVAIGERAVGPAGVSAEWRDLDRAQRGDGRRLIEERTVGMPPASEQTGRLGLGFLDDRMNIAMSRHALRVSVDGEGPQPRREGLVLGVS